METLVPVNCSLISFVAFTSKFDIVKRNIIFANNWEKGNDRLIKKGSHLTA